MNKNQAQAWVDELTQLLTGKNLILVSVTPIGVKIYQNQKFNKAYFIEYENGTCSVAISDSYGVMTGASDWSIDPDKRTVHAKTTNGYGELCQFAWAIAELDDDGKLWRTMKDIQERLWKIN